METRSRTAVKPGLDFRREADGQLRLTPEMSDTLRSGWDIYYHNEVYNAYAAAPFSSRRLRRARPLTNPHRRCRCRKSGPESFNMPDAGISSDTQAPGFFAAVSTRGQCVPDGSSLFCDMRYSGMQPLLVEVGGREQISEPPLWWTGSTTKGQAVSPIRIGYAPYIVLAGKDFCTRIFKDVLSFGGDGWHGLCGKGEAISLSLPHRLTRVLRRIRGKVTGKGDLAFTPDKLPDLVMLRAILVFPRKRALLFVDGYDGRWPRGAQMGNGRTHAFLMALRSGCVMFLALNLRSSETGLPTSRGTADYLSIEPIEGSTPQAGCVSAISCAPDGLNISVEVKGRDSYNTE